MSTLRTDNIEEFNTNYGVTIDGVLIKDGDIPEMRFKINRAKAFFAMNG